jgi:hypothetical protein
MIDPSTGWFEVKDVKDKSAKESMNTFDDVWLSRYLIPEYIGFDNGVEYKNVFKELVNSYGIKKKNSTPFNPQSNGIIERVDLALNDSLRTAEVDGRKMLKPQVRPVHKYPNSPWEMIHPPPGGDYAVCMLPYMVYMTECNKSLTATYQCKAQNTNSK